ncbi:glycosyltransferase family 4 protein [Sphingobacterium sp. Mn56C]|uniref:glycosyltransferase family 4 protein n=1 Tax=Sphingobacterium sp. Mn56C TaxID=3395261 RepID=UPI003BE72019
MRILIIHNFYQHAGGEDSVVKMEITELRKNHDVKLLTIQNKKGLKGLIQFSLYAINWSYAKRVVKTAKAFKADIVHIHNLHYASGPWLIRALRKHGFQVVMTLHNFRLICPSATLFYGDRLFLDSLKQDFPWSAVKNKVLDGSTLKTFVTAFTYWWHRKIGTWQQVNQYLLLSDFARQLFLKSPLGLAAEKYSIKPNFLPPVTVGEKTFGDYFVYIGRLSAEKGIIPLLQAICHSPHRIKVFGTGPQQTAVEALAAQFPNIEYMGFQQQDVLREELRTCSALVVPSVCYEGMPMTIIEAFAIGTPVLCSALGILQQMVIPLYSGMHFDPYREESIQNTLDSWVQVDNTTKYRISQNCKEVYTCNYTAEENIKSLEKLYLSAIHNHK